MLSAWHSGEMKESAPVDQEGSVQRTHTTELSMEDFRAVALMMIIEMIKYEES